MGLYVVSVSVEERLGSMEDWWEMLTPAMESFIAIIKHTFFMKHVQKGKHRKNTTIQMKGKAQWTQTPTNTYTHTKVAILFLLITEELENDFPQEVNAVSE